MQRTWAWSLRQHEVCLWHGSPEGTYCSWSTGVALALVICMLLLPLQKLHDAAAHVALRLHCVH